MNNNQHEISKAVKAVDNNQPMAATWVMATSQHLVAVAMWVVDSNNTR